MNNAQTMKQLKQLLNAATNADVLDRVQQLQKPQPESLIVAVQWQPGEPSAGVTILSGGNPPLALIAETLRRGAAMVMAQMEQIAAQAQSDVAQLQAELREARVKDSS